ncbi:hypothetical protein P8452_51665 [Trifolium repens]|nr:hypothetical protein P8452_51665 [Trifolium repens]
MKVQQDSESKKKPHKKKASTSAPHARTDLSVLDHELLRNGKFNPNFSRDDCLSCCMWEFMEEEALGKVLFKPVFGNSPSHKRFREFSLRNEFWANF